MIRDWNLFLGLAEATNLSIKEGTIECKTFNSVDWEKFPLHSKSYLMRIVINSDLFRGGFSKPIIEFWDCEGRGADKYTLYFSNGSWKDVLTFLGIEKVNERKAFRFLSEVCLIGQEENYLGNKNEKIEIMGISNAPKVIRVERFMGDCETFYLGHIVPIRRFASFDELMDDTHKIYVQACAKHLKSDEKKAEKERDRG